VAVLVLAACAGGPPTGSTLEARLESEVIALRHTIKRLEGELAGTGEAPRPDRLAAELHQVFQGTEVSVERRGSVTHVGMPARHLFRDNAGSLFRVEATMTLDLLATALALHPTHIVTVEGHTNDRSVPDDGPVRFHDNLDLSLHYARTVADRLIHQFGLSAERVVVAGRSNWNPIASNELPDGQDENRRVEFHIRPPPPR
jgi:outer membrane protein OmpA-like peptidoglycan-associated protein